MPRYYFNVTHGATTVDEAGIDLPDITAAWNEAAEAAGELIADLHGSLSAGRDWKMEVTDEFLNPLWEIQLKGSRTG